MSITDPHLSDCFNDEIENPNKQLKTFGTLIDGATAINQCHRQFVTSAVGVFHVFIAVYVFVILPVIFCLSLCFQILD